MLSVRIACGIFVNAVTVFVVLINIPLLRITYALLHGRLQCRFQRPLLTIKLLLSMACVPRSRAYTVIAEERTCAGLGNELIKKSGGSSTK